MLAVLVVSATLLAADSPAPPHSLPKEKIEAPVTAIGLVPVKKDEKVVCHKEQLLGSRMFKTVCMSEEDAAERRAMDQNALRAIQDMSKTGNPP